METEIEKRIFGYIDPNPPPEGSWKAEVFKLVEQAESISDEMLEKCVIEFSASVVRMRQAQEKFFAKELGLRLTPRVPDAVYCTGCGDEIIPLCPECSGEE